jgi:Zn-dependent protease
MKYKFHFSAEEIPQIAGALFALAFSFEFILFRDEIFKQGALFNLPAMLVFFVQALIAVGVGFVLHELGHKYVAQKKGLWAEFRAWPAGLLLAIGMALISRGGFVFAAPGAVVINPFKKTKTGFAMKKLKKEDVGHIGIIGSIINISIAGIAAVIAAFTGFHLAALTAQVNSWLAIFNMIPLSVLDGAKVWHWSKSVWFGFTALCVAVFVLTVLL